MPRLNLPTGLTLVRLALTPVVVTLVVVDARGQASAAVAVIFALVAATDWLDGRLARRRGQVTALGSFLDPLADKLLIGGCLIALATQGRVAGWVVALVVTREVSVTIARAVLAHRGATLPASALGKVKMEAQVVAVIVLIAAPDPGHVWVHAIVYAAAALTVVSALEYLSRAVQPLLARPSAF